MKSEHSSILPLVFHNNYPMFFGVRHQDKNKQNNNISIIYIIGTKDDTHLIESLLKNVLVCLLIRILSYTQINICNL